MPHARSNSDSKELWVIIKMQTIHYRERQTEREMLKIHFALDRLRCQIIIALFLYQKRKQSHRKLYINLPLPVYHITVRLHSRGLNCEHILFSLFFDYLKDGKKRVAFQEPLLISYSCVNTRVPQGPILDSVYLFLIYINDLFDTGPK